MADAINVMVHVDPAGCGFGEGEAGEEGGVQWEGQPVLPTHGAVWHIFTQADTKVMQAMLPRIAQRRGRRLHSTALASSAQPLFDASLYLDGALLTQLQQEAGIVPYTVLQGVGDAVVVPAGCAHQVRNLRSCVRVAADFVAPEHISHCLRLTDELRFLPPTHHRRTDLLNVRTLLFHAACACLATLDAEARRREEHKRKPPLAARAAALPAPVASPAAVAAAAAMAAAPSAGPPALLPLVMPSAAAAMAAAPLQTAPVVGVAMPPPAAAQNPDFFAFCACSGGSTSWEPVQML